jgi:hypothetical protein
MTDYICPLNNHACRCDPNATDKKFHPCALSKRIGTLIRLMGSNFEGEATNAATKLQQLLAAKGLFNDIAILIENCDGQIEERKYSDAEAEVIFARGVKKGRAEQIRMQETPSEFYDADGRPRWNAIALFCQKNHQRLRSVEQGFVDDMAGSTLWREPSEKQGKWLLSIFLRLGGRRQ